MTLQTVTLQTGLAAAAGLVSLAFALSVFERWLADRRPYNLAWAVSLAMFTLGAGALWLGAANGWDGPTFRAFYLFGAVLNVPILALGTIYLLGGRELADRVTAAVALGCAFATGVLVVAPFRRPIPVDALPKGSDVFGALPRALAAVASAAGALVVLAGAVRSAWGAREGGRGERGAREGGRGAGTRRLAGANVLIAAGTLVLGAGGVLNSALGAMEAFAVSLVAGITLLFAGFLMATARPNPPPELAAADTAGNL